MDVMVRLSSGRAAPGLQADTTRLMPCCLDTCHTNRAQLSLILMCLALLDTTFQVVFDPLDGSSIVGANFAVGSIFGIYPVRSATAAHASA
jgi:hypothetical protein